MPLSPGALPLRLQGRHGARPARRREPAPARRARPRCTREDAPLWQRYEQACDFLEDDLESGYVRVLQEMIAAGWSNPEIADAVRDDAAPAGSSCSPTWPPRPADVRRPRARSPAEESATLVGNAFIGAEALLLLGFDRHQMPIRAALRTRRRADPRAARNAAARRRTADEGAASRARRLRRARRRASSTGRCSATGDADDRAAADVVDHPLAPLEAAGALPRPPLPGRHLRRPRQRPLGPAVGRVAPTLDAEFAADTARRARRHRHRPTPCSSASRAACSGACSVAADSPGAGRAASCSSGPPFRSRRCIAEPSASTASTSRLETTEGGPSTTGTTGSTATTTTSSSSSSHRCSPSRTRPSRSRTASSGAWRSSRRRWSTHRASLAVPAGADPSSLRAGRAARCS